MKKLKIIITAIALLSVVPSTWAMSPGGAVDGGGKTAQHAQQTSTTAPVESPRMHEAEILQLEAVAATPVAEAAPVEAVAATQPSSETPTTPAVDETAPTQPAVGNASKKAMRQELKSAMKAQRDSAAPQSTTSSDKKLLCVIVALFIPWLGVALYMDGITTEFWICLLLWFLFILPGLIYALWVILR
jgi:uncharacterized membrane protein YqaE (UPF0057 family)